MELGELIQFFPYIVGIVFLLLVVVVIYFFWAKPKQETPLPNEVPIGHLSIYLPNIGLQSGYATTARKTLDRFLNQSISNQTDPQKRVQVEEFRRKLTDYYPLAHRVGRKIWIYIFDQDPLGMNFMDINPDEGGRIIHDVKNVYERSELGDWIIAAVKLSTERIEFSKDELDTFSTVCEGVGVLRDAAKNTIKIKAKTDECNYYREAYGSSMANEAKMRSERDIACHAASIIPLTSQPAKGGGEWKAKLKEWFSIWQIGMAVATFLFGPYVIQYVCSTYNVVINPSVTPYLVGAATVLAFFIIPLYRKFAEWLSSR